MRHHCLSEVCLQAMIQREMAPPALHARRPGSHFKVVVSLQNPLFSQQVQGLTGRLLKTGKVDATRISLHDGQGLQG